MAITAYFASLNVLKLWKSMPANIAQGLIWGIMALGIYITFRVLDVADLTVKLGLQGFADLGIELSNVVHVFSNHVNLPPFGYTAFNKKLSYIYNIQHIGGGCQPFSL